MKTWPKTVAIAAFLLCFILVSQAQKRNIITVAELETLMNSNNDTVYVLNFWATWCKPCVAELPHFEKLNQDPATPRIKVILVTIDFSDIFESKVLPFLKKRGIRSDVLLLDEVDGNKWIDKVSPEWGGAIPATLVVANGRKINDFYGQAFETYEDLFQIVKPYIYN